MGPTMTMIYDPNLVQTCSMGTMSGFQTGKYMSSTSCCVRKSNGVTWCVGRGIVLDIHKVLSKSARCTYYRGEAWCGVGVWAFHPASPFNSSHHGGWNQVPWPKPATRLITEDTVPPVPKVPPLVCSPHPQWCQLWSKVNLGHRARRLDQLPADWSLLTENLLQNQQIISTRRRGAKLKCLP